MYQIVYTSEATVDFSSEDLRQLLAVARAKNKVGLITGMLVFCDNQFLQVLEGSMADVVRTYDRIATDLRHDNLMALYRGNSQPGKTFSSSAMGFHSMALGAALPPGFVREAGRVQFAHFDEVQALNFLVACRTQPALV